MFDRKSVFLLPTLFLSLGMLGACAASPAQTAVSPAPVPATTDVPAVETSGEYHKISAEDAKDWMENWEVTIVDVRTTAEYAEGHIPGAILVPNEIISDTSPDALPDLNATLLVYCRSGRRSKDACMKLLAIGYQNVYDLGGIIDWPYDTVKD